MQRQLLQSKGGQEKLVLSRQTMWGGALAATPAATVQLWLMDGTKQPTRGQRF